MLLRKQLISAVGAQVFALGFPQNSIRVLVIVIEASALVVTRDISGIVPLIMVLPRLRYVKGDDAVENKLST